MRKKIIQKLNNLSLVMLLVDLRAQSLGLNPSAWTLMWILLTTTIYFMGLLFITSLCLKMYRYISCVSPTYSPWSTYNKY